MPLTVSTSGYRDFSEPRFFEGTELTDVAKIYYPVDKSHAIIAPTLGGSTSLYKFYAGDTTAADGADVLAATNPAVSGRWRRIGRELDMGLFGVTGNGTTDDTAAMQTAFSAAAATGHTLLIRGTPLITDTLTVTAGASRFSMRGEGIRATRLICRVNGASVIDAGDSLWTDLSDFSMEGDSNSGHAIRMVSPTPGSAPYYPQHFCLYRLYIYGFTGADVDHTGAAMPAAGVFAMNALEADIMHCTFTNNDAGVWLYNCYTIKTHFCTFDGNTGAAAYIDERGEGCTFLHNDVVNGALTASTFDLIAINTTGSKTVQKSGIVLSICLDATIAFNKFKNYYNQIYSSNYVPPTVTGNFIVVDVENGIYSTGPLFVTNNRFYPFYVAGTASTRKYINYAMVGGEEHWIGSITGNDFAIGGGGYFDAFISITNTNSSYPSNGIIQGNRFGQATTVANTSLVRAGVIFTHVDGLVIRNNTTYVPTGLTITTLWSLPAGSSGVGAIVEDNVEQTDGGTLTTVFSPPSAGFNYRYVKNGVIQQIDNLKTLFGTGTPEGAVTAGVGSQYYRTDGGATTTLYIKTSGTGNTGWTAK